MANKILIVSERKTQRMVYIFNLILKNLLGLQVDFVSENDLIEDKTPLIAYGSPSSKTNFFIAADELLFERGIRELDFNYSTHKNLPCFFTTYHPKSIFPFDLFAASFFLVSRYEEYLPFIKDAHGRFDAPQSIAFQKGFLDKPMVNIWALELGFKLKEYYPDIELKTSEFKYLPTIDIDAVYSFKQKGFWRTAGGYFKDFRDQKWQEVLNRTLVLRGIKTDPFDSFDYIFSFHHNRRLKPIFFVLFADYGTNDKNLPINNRRFQSVVRRLMDYGTVGIHPSFTSNKLPDKVEQEIQNLSKVIHSEIFRSRQHFLMLSFPETYKRLIDIGITEDYTMGYASCPGFRAGIASPFYFYNLEFEMVTHLKVFPFAYMEGTLKDYQNLEPEQALKVIKNLTDAVYSVGGLMISLWHNESLGGKNRWEGWPEVYEQAVDYALEKIELQKL
ncbi:MAG: polysaccharide deacetylase family protein [Bacteroidales bacterium]|nr:polysaccharide deacetylase family protein [Bacteroidales bacterium]